MPAQPKVPKKRPRQPSNPDLLLHWALTIQHQQLLIAEIVQCLGAPPLPGHVGQLHKHLSVTHFENWLKEEDVPLELVAGLLDVSIEERATRKVIGERLTGHVVSKLIDLHTRRNSDRDVSDIRNVFQVDRVKAERPEIIRREEGRGEFFEKDHEDERSDAFEDAWKNLCDQTEKILSADCWLPFPQNDFELALFERWQSKVLPALNDLGPGFLACLMDPEAVNHIPARRAKDKIDRIRRTTAQKRGSGVEHQEYSEAEEGDEADVTLAKLYRPRDAADDEFFRFPDSSKSAEDTASEDEEVEILSQQVNEAVAHVTTNDAPAMSEAVKFILRGGGLYDEASEKYNIPKSTLNDRILKAKERIIKIRHS
jgi:hypothetical protein